MNYKPLKNALEKTFILLSLVSVFTFSQEIKYMSVGSLHNWYSEYGCEIEVGGPAAGDQQDGLQWPAIYSYQDAQAAKAMWIGAKDFWDAKIGDMAPYKVVHVGPRVLGRGEVFPISFKMKSKYEKPDIQVNGAVTEGKPYSVDEIDPSMPWDREIVSIVGTQLGVTMTRRIFQFQNQFHENYIVNDYVFKNTGDTDGELTTIEKKDSIVKELVVYFQYRLAVCKQTAPLIGNPTSWGMNSTYDARGDGNTSSIPGWEKPDEKQFRAQYVWHGRFPAFTDYDNVGGPIWKSALYIPSGDTSGRLGAPQFAGVVTLHADTSPTDKSDDTAQPFTTNTVQSDGALQSQNDTYNSGKMEAEYTTLMTTGHDKRHLDKIEETNPILPTKDPALGGGSGGYTMANGYGPYTLNFGDSVHIVVVEAVAGISRERAVEVGRQFKADKNVLVKNTAFFTGKDSLFQTFKRAKANYDANWQLPEVINTPAPVSTFSANAAPRSVGLKWTLFNENDPDVSGFEIYRAVGRVDSNYYKIADLDKAARTYNDYSAPSSINSYYYIVTVGENFAGDAALNIPVGNLKSNRFYSQLYSPALPGPVVVFNEFVVVPNPFISAANSTNLGTSGSDRRLSFYGIPDNHNLKIYTEYGELIKTFTDKDPGFTKGSKKVDWNQLNTDANQIIVSGIYIAVLRDGDSGETKIQKFVIIR
ncbi:MAG: hypothetical protein AUJ54_00815 [Ignavibacteria bacterium CG1_02_37_35]|nr:MAG: hypothetical protein AUJ54_00815 [Ignavibacteria bacterium CG1_02_37_35]PJC58331.1 MAG: hypothetical protein CO025_09705 [Ignavibacteria bacterium CG_4_9_14_0_2_um_filter_37_13]